ncbi:MAG: HlyD family type I secretion periplasmic adaptor subunit [Alphaproteobacteria bacterium]
MNLRKDYRFSPTFRLTLWGLITILVTIIIVSFVAKMEVVVKGEGRTIPKSKIWEIQSQLGGLVVKDDVFEGKIVHKGEQLLVIDQNVYKSNLKDIKESLNNYKCLKNSYSYLLQQNQSFFDKDLDVKNIKYNDCVRFNIKVEHSHVQQQMNRLNLLDDEYKNQLREQTERQKNLTTIMKIYDKQFERRKQLLTKELISLSKFADFQKEYLQYKQELSNVETAVATSQHQIEQNDKEKDILLTGKIYEWASQVADLERNINSQNISLAQTQEDLNNSVITAPISGIVEQKSYGGKGSFIPSFQTLFSIVPFDDELIMEVSYENRDIGLIKPNQKANIKLEAFPAERYDRLTGKVLRISQESTLKANGNKGSTEKSKREKWIYLVDVKMDKQYISKKEERHKLMAGMTGEVDIIVGKRRVISFLFDPIARALKEVAREP